MKTLGKLFVASLGLLSSSVAFAGETKNDAPPPTAYLVSDAHLDTQWNWDIQTTIKDYVWNTINQNLELLEKYPDYVFNFEGGVKYSWMKEYYPREYELLKKYIKNGRWHISGASWDATDAIVPSIESAIRNVLLGQTYYRDEFGVESTDIFLPDCFGFGWTLPTVASHCGLIGFSSQKLGWRLKPFHGDQKYPYTLGLWKGVDGSTIMMAHGYGYGTRWKNEDLTQSESLLNLAKLSPTGITFHYYGTGDVGGSPTITSVEAVQRAVGTDGPVKVISAASDAVFQKYLPYDQHPELPCYDGELLMDVHGTGCYTSQAAMKLYNRQNELLGDAAERAAVGAQMVAGEYYPGESLTEAWRRFIFHQFHDDLTGTSIPRAYEFSWNDELLSLKQFASILGNSVDAVANNLDTNVKGTPVVLYNALGTAATDVVEIELDAKKKPAGVQVFDNNGKQATAQLLSYEDGKAKVLFQATVPANGYAVYDVRLGGKQAKSVSQSDNTLENSAYAIKFDKNGDITSLIDKASGTQLVKDGEAIRLALFTENKSYAWPAWEVIKETIDATPVSITGDVKMTLVENGPLRKTMLVEKTDGNSKFRQYVRLYEGALANRIDFMNDIDWATQNALLKAEFPFAFANPKACYDLGIGTVERGNNTDIAYEVYSQRWADLTGADGNFGATVMNDSKYGWDKPNDNTVRLTLLHTPATKRGYAYQDHQDLGHHNFTYSLVPHKGKLDKAVANYDADVLNQRVKAFTAPKHKGTLGREYSALSSDNKAVAIRAFKKAENSDEYVVRVYETSGMPQSAVLNFALPLAGAVEADGTEKTIGNAKFSDNTLAVNLTPNSIKTFKVKFQGMANKAKNATAVTLPYNKKCYSWNQFGGDADFEGGYAYAAELVPATLVHNGTTFTLENKALLNGLACKGDTLALPEGDFNRVYILAAAALPEGNTSTGVVKAGKTQTELNVPSYTGFIGQWGHTGHTEAYLLPDDIAFTGTHRHSAEGDHPYEFTYMYKYAVDVPAGVKEIVLPDNPEIVIFAATAVKEDVQKAQPLAPIFRTGFDANAKLNGLAKKVRPANILKPEHLKAWSGFVNDGEHPRYLTDGDSNTKWCDVGGIPSYVIYDLGTPQTLSGWYMENAGSENPSYITTSCLLQTRNNENEEWKTVDSVVANSKNTVEKNFKEPVSARYVRLLVIQPTQSIAKDTRIYEFALY